MLEKTEAGCGSPLGVVGQGYVLGVVMPGAAGPGLSLGF